MKFGNLLHIKDAAFLLHLARSFIQTWLHKGVIAVKMNIVPIHSLLYAKD